MNQPLFLDVQQQYVAQLLGQINNLLANQVKLVTDLKAANDKIAKLEKGNGGKK